MKIHRNVTPSPAELVTVTCRELINRALTAAQVGRPCDFDKSVKAAKWLWIFDKGMRWIEASFMDENSLLEKLKPTYPTFRPSHWGGGGGDTLTIADQREWSYYQ